jgi:hypothetical protein
MLALDGGALARVVIGATRMPVHARGAGSSSWPRTSRGSSERSEKCEVEQHKSKQYAAVDSHDLQGFAA